MTYLTWQIFCETPRHKTEITSAINHVSNRPVTLWHSHFELYTSE